jgi:ribose 5-phosphate isomerase B
MNRIVIASDHAGFPLKEKIKDYLKKNGYAVKDLGTDSGESCDYPDFAASLARAIAKKKYPRGIAICGSGIGVSIVANRYAGVRAALCYNATAAALSRQHNDSNVLALGARFINAALAKRIVKVWLETKFEGGRHTRRLNKIKDVECQLRSSR